MPTKAKPRADAAQFAMPLVAPLSDEPLAATLQRAFDHFNKTLFGGALPTCVLVVHRHRTAHGYFWNGQWVARNADGSVDAKNGRHEIAMNPESFTGRDTKTVLSTLVHEMVHLQQEETGKPSQSGHNKEWGRMMLDVGLLPFAVCQPRPDLTGYTPGGDLPKVAKATGRKVTHVVVPGGAFDVSCDDLLATGYALGWTLKPKMPTALAAKKRASKTKYTCPSCATNIWGKPDINMICGDCNEFMGEA